MPIGDPSGSAARRFLDATNDPAAQAPLPIPTDRSTGVDFDDADSQRVLTAAALTVARRLGRDAAREYYAELTRTAKEV